MKRHPSLTAFSDDHHQGLVHARQLRKAASGEGANSADTARNFLEFWQADTSLHFRKEEEVLLPVLARYGGDLGEQPLLQMLTQHARIRGLAMQLSDEFEQNKIREDTLQNLGEQLEAHFRLEERHVFPLIEQTLPEHALQEVAHRLDVFETGPPHEPWVPAEGFSFDPWPGPGDSEGGARTDTSGNPAESVEPLLLHKGLDGFEGSLALATRRSGEIATVTIWESEEALRATEGPSYWLRAFSAEAAGGEVTGLDRYEVVSSEAWRARA